MLNQNIKEEHCIICGDTKKDSKLFFCFQCQIIM